MTSPLRRLAALVGAALTLMASAAHAQDYTPEAKRVLAQARAASGGAAWNSLRSWHEVGTENGESYELWVDPVRFGFRIQVRQPDGLHVHAFNGAADWLMPPSGVITGVDDAATVAQARTTAFFSAYGYFFPSRYQGRGSHLGVRRDRGRSFEALQIIPPGGRPRELWFDRSTHLLSRIIDRTGPRPVIVELSDYRKVGPVRAPFRFVTEAPDPAGRSERKVETIDFPVGDRALFSYPPGTVPRPAPAIAAPAAKPLGAKSR